MFAAFRSPALVISPLAFWDTFRRYVDKAGLDPRVVTPHVLATLTGHLYFVNSCAFSPDGRKIVSGSLDKTLKLWDADSGAELSTLTGHTSWVTSCAFSPDGSRIVSTSRDRTLKLWDTDDGQLIDTFIANGAVSSCAFSPLNNMVACGDEGGNVYILELIGFGFSPMKPEKKPFPPPIEFAGAPAGPLEHVPEKDLHLPPAIEFTGTKKKRRWRSRKK